ncbi:MAG: 3-phosphoglycerate dehydrogenase family protein [Firmicutes bacterium]|nr:3-phosphoglycerate dehydrogenase family protein [Bacillota bacterium]
MYNILKLNEISDKADPVFAGKYKLTKECASPDAIILRSFNMHEYNLPKNLLCVARAGAGVNNIPIEKCSKQGIVVFNTPGANANAVKELIICALLIGSRKILDAIDWTKTLKSDDIMPDVEKGKAKFVGPEILGKKIGIIGLGAIGALVANTCAELGMTVLGYDPYISVDSAWGLKRSVRHITNINTIFEESDYISINIPYKKENAGFINKENFKLMKNGVVIVNCSRGELVNNKDIIDAIKSKKVGRYITDFPSSELLNIENIICIPHLGASTPEAEDNCAVAAAKELVSFIEDGTIKNSVNFPNCEMPRAGISRLSIIHLNIKEILSKITSAVSAKNINMANFVDKSLGEYAYCMLDLDDSAPADLIKKLENIEGVIKVREIK